ncbi:tetratricopeptide repeat protein [Geodermatophilus sp. SYSU D00758]
MRAALTTDQVEELELGARTPEQRRAASARLEQWAADPQPGDDLSPAALLVQAGELRGMAGDAEAALALFERAAEAGGEVVPDVRTALHHGLVRVGRLDEARRLAEEVRRSRPRDADVYALIGEDYEEIGDLPEANRWLNLALQRLLAQTEDPLGEAPGMVAAMVLVARRRVRERLGFPPDEFDLGLSRVQETDGP